MPLGGGRKRALVPMLAATFAALVTFRCPGARHQRGLPGPRGAAAGSGHHPCVSTVPGRGERPACTRGEPATLRPPPASPPATRDSCQSSSRAAAERGANDCGAGEGREDACTGCARRGQAPPRCAPPRPAARGALAPHRAAEIVPLRTSSRVRGLRSGGTGGRATAGPRRSGKLQPLGAAEGPVPPHTMSGRSRGRRLRFCPDSGQTHPPSLKCSGELGALHPRVVFRYLAGHPLQSPGPSW